MEELDDDFGELYAAVEVQVSASINAIPSVKHVHEELDGKNEEKTVGESFRSNRTSMEVDAPNENAGANPENGKVIVNDSNRSYTAAGCEKGLILENGSDSDDDLHIVLNEEDGHMSGIPYGANAGNLVEGSDDEDEDDDLVIVTEDDNSGKVGKLSDQLQMISDGLEQGSGTGTERGNGIKSGYSSQYKYIRSYGATYSSNNKITGSGPTISVPSSSSRRGDWDVNGFNQPMRSSLGPVASSSTATFLMPVQSGCGFCLPRNRTIFDVNIETIDPKPWRHPGVDISDFFNFGLDEESWKEYCNCLEQIRQQEFLFTSCSRPYQVYQTECGKDAVAEEFAQLQQEERVSPVINKADRRLLELPKGRAIQVEGSIRERRSSMDVRRPRNRDSDVVIQISVQESTEIFSCSSKEEPGCINDSIPEGSEIGGFGMDVDQKAHSARSMDGHSRELDVSSVKDTELCPLARCSRSDASSALSVDPDNPETNVLDDECDNPNLKEHACEEPSEIVEMIKDKLEEANKIPSRADRRKFKAESSNQFQHSSSLSYSDSRSKSYKAGSDIDKEKTYDTAKRTSSESSTPDSSHSKGIGSNDSRREPEDCRDNFENRSPLQEKNQCSRLRLRSVAEVMIHVNDDVAIMESDRKGWDDDDCMTQSRVKQKEEQRDYDFNDREDFLYYRECEMPIRSQSERLAKKHARNGYIDFSYKKSPFRDEMNPYPRRAWHEREHFLEKRTGREFKDSNLKHKGYHIPKKGHSDSGMRTASYVESAWLTSENHICSDEERHSWRPRKRNDEPIERRNDDFVVEHGYREEFVQVNYQRPVPYCGRKREHFQEKCNRYAQSCSQEIKGSNRRERYWDSLRSNLLYDSCRSASYDDEYWEHFNHETLSSPSGRESPFSNRRGHRDSTSVKNDAYGSRRLDQREVHHWRRIHSLKHKSLVDRNRDDYNADYLDNERRCFDQSMVFDWPGVELSSRSRGRVDTEESFSPFGSSRHESVLVKREVSHGAMLFDDDWLEHDRKRMIREERRYSQVCNRISSSFANIETNVQAALRCRDSVEQQHLIGWEGKSRERASKAVGARCNNRIEKTIHPIDQEWRTFRHSSESYSCKVVPSCSSKGESNFVHDIRSKVERVREYDQEHSTDPSNRTLPHKSYSNQQDKTSVLEDGQLAKELGTEKGNCTEAKWMSEKTSLAGITKEKGATSEDAADNNIGGYDNNRILATLAKMEKRRERFMEPITLKKEPDNNLKPQNNVAETTEVKQQRPTRKRRWGGS